MVKLRARKRDLEFCKSLPAFDRRLGDADPIAYLGASGRAMASAAAEQWGYHVCDALRTARLALAMAHSNQHPGIHDRISRLSIKASWFNLAVLSLQSSWNKLAWLIRCSLSVTEWQSRDERGKTTTKRVSDYNTNLWTAQRHLEATERRSPADHQLAVFVARPDTKVLNRVANNLKHGETLAWKGFAVVPVVEVEYDVRPVEPRDATPKRQDVGWLFHTQRTETLPDGRKVTARMHYGHNVQFDLDVAVRQVASVYRAFVPVAEAVAREYLGRAAEPAPECP